MKVRRKSISNILVVFMCVAILFPTGLFQLQPAYADNVDIDPAADTEATTPAPENDQGLLAAYPPISISMSFNGSPQTNRAFAWYTSYADPQNAPANVKDSIVEVVPADQEFDSAAVMRFVGDSKDTQILENLNLGGTTGSFISHKAIVTGLTPGTAYKYRVGSDGNWSQPGRITTEGDNENEYEFLYMTDSQGANTEDYRVWADSLGNALDDYPAARFLVMPGDLVDAGAREDQWSDYFGQPQDLLMNLPLMATIGNHEGPNNNNFFYHFNLPDDSHTDPKPRGTVYSFDYGPAHIMVLNTGDIPWDAAQTDSFNKQIEWLRKEAAQTDKKWKIVAFHKAIYSVGNHATDSDIAELREKLYPVLDELGIDLVLQGHDHTFMRSHQMYNNQPVTDVQTDDSGRLINPDGTLYMINNSPGRKYYQINPNVDKYFAATYQQPNKPIYSGVQITEDSLTINSYISGEDTPFDSYTIVQNSEKPNPVEGLSAKRVDGNKTELSWTKPADKSADDAVRGFRVYEVNGRLGPNWSGYVPAVEGQTDYQYTVDNTDPVLTYEFAVKAVDKRDNSAASTVSTDGNVAMSISKVEQTPMVRADGKQETKASIINNGDEFTGWAKITVGTEPAYMTSVGAIAPGVSEVIVPVTDTNEMLEPGETTSMKLELYDNELGEGPAKAVYESGNWERTRHWEFYLSQQMHTDLGYTDYQENLKKSFSGYLDSVKQYMTNSDNRATDLEKYKYAIESAFMMGESFMKNRTADQIEELKDLIEADRMIIGAGQFNYTPENFSTEGAARAAYYTNRHMVDMLGIDPTTTEYFFDNPSISKGYVDTAVRAGIKYGIHSMNFARSPYYKVRQFDLFYMQGMDPANKMLIFNGQKYTADYGLGGDVNTAYTSIMNLIRDLENRSGRGANPEFPYDKFAMALVPAGDNRPPDEKHIKVANELNAKWHEDGKYVYPRIKTAFPEEFFEDVEQEYGHLIPTETGTEENWWNDGWGTTAYESGIAKEGEKLIPVAETTASLATALQGTAYPYADLADAIQRSMLYNEHTWGASSFSGNSNYHNQFEWKRSNAFAARELADKVLTDSLKQLSSQVQTEGQGIYVYNSLNWVRDDKVTVTDLTGLPEHFIIKDGADSVPYTVTDGVLTFIADEVPALGYKTFEIEAVDETPTFAPQVITGDDFIENAYYKVTFAEDGTIASIIDKQNDNREIVDQQAPVRFNQYQYYDDFGIPNSNEGVNFSPDKWKLYTPKAEESKFDIQANGYSAVASLNTSTLRSSNIRQHVTLYNDIPRIDIMNEVLKESLPTLQSKEEAFYTFPFQTSGSEYEIRYDLPIGNTTEGEQVYGTSTDWYTANKWVNVKDKNDNYNMTLAIPNTSLLQFGERRTGNWSFDYQSEKPYIYSYVMNNMWHTNFQGDQPGEVDFKYSIFTNKDADTGEIARFGWETSTPLQATVITEAQDAQSGPMSDNLIQVRNENVQLTTMKSAEANSDGMILRFHEITGHAASDVTVTLPFAGVSSVTETDIIENDLSQVSDSGTFTFDLPAYGIKTFRVRYGEAPVAVTNLQAVSTMAGTQGTQLQWDAVEGASYYEIFRDKDPEFIAGSGNYLGTTNQTVWFDTQVTSDTGNTYYYRVRAAGAGAKGAASAAVAPVANNIVDTMPPASPVLGAETRSESRIDLFWTPVTDDVMIQNYVVYRDGVKLGGLDDNHVTSYRERTAEPGKPYTYTVEAVDTSGNVARSNEVTIEAGDKSIALSGLEISSGVLSPRFDSKTRDYSLKIGNNFGRLEGVKVTPRLSEDDLDAVITVNGVQVESGAQSDLIPLQAEGDTILIRVEKGEESRVYEITASSKVPIIPPANATAGSEYSGADVKAAANLINNSGMSGDSSLEDTHAVHSNATGMWHTANNPGDKAWAEIDLGKVYPLDEMWIWNLNQSGNAINIKRGLRNVKIEYSTDKSDWSALSPSTDLVFKEDTDPDYPFQLKQGTALDAMKATNLNDDQSSPVRFDGKKARYVRITAHPTKGIGTWGDSYFGLSELRFTSQLELSDHVPVESITIAAENDANEISVYGGSLQLSAKVEPSDASYPEVKWSVTDEEGNPTKLAMITENGKLTASHNGVVKVVAAAIDNPAISDSYTVLITGQKQLLTVASVTAGSTYSDTKPAENLINGSGMSTMGTVFDVHDNHGSANTMWHSAAYPEANAWVEFDFGTVSDIGEMWIWNLNQNLNSNRGLKDVKIEYKVEQEDAWIELKGPGSVNDKEYPYTLAKASGNPDQAATNLENGQPVVFNNQAQFVRITADPVVGQGTYGGEYYGLSEVRFIRDVQAASTGTIHGTVSDGENGVYGASVSVTVDGVSHQATTAEDGAYSIADVPEGTGYTVTASKAGYIGSSVTDVVVKANETTTVNVRLTAIPPVERAGTISGTVSDSVYGVEGATVSVTVDGASYQATTAEDGAYSIAEVPEGTGYVVTASKAGYASASATDVSVTADETTSVHLVLTEESEPDEETYALTITAGRGGRITVGASGDYEAGQVIAIAAQANSRYSFNGWTSTDDGVFANANSASTTFTMPANETTITARFTYVGSDDGDDNGNDGGGDGSTPTPVPKPEDEPTEPTEPTEPVEPDEPETPTVELSDIADHWAKAAIEKAVALGFVNGYEDGTFRANRKVTRGEVSTMLARALKLELDDTEFSFADQDQTPAWAQPFIQAIAKAGFISGYEDGSFRTNNEITRSELVVIIVRALGLEVNPNATSGFDDADQIPAWARPYVAAAEQAGLIKGNGDGKFNPNTSSTRAEAVTLILAVMDHVK